MLKNYLDINPIAFSIGGFDVYWYSLAYVIGIMGGYVHACKISLKFSSHITPKHLENYISWAIIGIILGGRFGYILLYDPLKYFSNLWEIFKIREGGMSFHGGFLGIVISSYLYCWRHKISFYSLCDILAAISPIGLFLGRLANFVNGELYGRVADEKWGMIFKNSDMQPRYPSQLLEAFLEGIVLFIIINICTFKFKTIEKKSLNSVIFLVLYGIFRIIAEFFREPDFQIGYFFGGFTMGQLLCLPMFMTALYLIKKFKLLENGH